MNRLPLISVLIPVYNGEKYIKECLDSIINQTYSNLEIIIVDDGSTDSTAEICKKYVLKDKRIDFIQKENGGVSSARNTLIKAAKGHYIQFIDADDWIEPNMIEIMITGCIQYSSDISMCKFKSNKEPLKNNGSSSIENIQILNTHETMIKFLEHREITGSLCNKLIKSNLIKKLRFNQYISYGEDAVMLWDIIKSIKRLIVIKIPLYNYRMNESSLSHSGLSPQKMTAIKAWEYITKSIPNNDEKISSLANARFGAEMTLLLYNALRSKNYDNENIIKLRKIIKSKLHDMIYCNILSNQFKAFAIISVYNWKLISLIGKVI